MSLIHVMITHCDTNLSIYIYFLFNNFECINVHQLYIMRFFVQYLFYIYLDNYLKIVILLFRWQLWWYSVFLRHWYIYILQILIVYTKIKLVKSYCVFDRSVSYYSQSNHRKEKLWSMLCCLILLKVYLSVL